MRKFLLLSLVTLLTSVTALADVAAFIPTGSTAYKGTATGDNKVTMSDGSIMDNVFTIPSVVDFQWTKKNSNTSNVSGAVLKWYASDVLTVTPASGVTITKISFKASGTSYLGGDMTTSWGIATKTTAATTPATWEPKAGETQPESFTITFSKQLRAQYIEIEYTAGGETNSVKMPKIALLANNTVEITQEDNQTIHYTLNGTEPTVASPEYTGTFTISKQTTVKAVAVNEAGELSGVTTAVLTPNVLADIAQFLEYKPTTATRIDAPLTIIYKNGRNMYLKDANESFILAYNSGNVVDITNLTAVNGDQISFIEGTYKSQAGLPELIPSTIGEKTAGTAVDPYEVEVSDIDMSMLNQYVTFGPVNIAAIANKANNYTATNADGASITLYNTFSNSSNYDVVEVPEGEGFTVTGFVSCYNSTIQVTPIAVEGGMENVAAPEFSVASGAVAEGTSVEITCATEGATIYYTVDETVPAADNGYEYKGQPISITSATVLKAIAVKEGMLDSDVATASYTIKEPAPEGEGTVTFVFCDEANGFNLEPAITIPTENNGSVSLHEQTFTNDVISVTFDKGANTSNNPVFFYPTAVATKGQVEARIYKQNTIAFAASDGVIKNVKFEQWSNSTTWAGFTTATEGMDEIAAATAKEFTSADGVSTLILTSTGTSRFKQISVTYVVDGSAAIEDIVTDGDADAPVEYFNLQGIKVSADNLTPGIYVRRQGSKVTKVLVL